MAIVSLRPLLFLDSITKFLALSADGMSISTLKAIASNHTRHFIVINHTTNNFTSKTIAQSV